jgi:hypothetical protein
MSPSATATTWWLKLTITLYMRLRFFGREGKHRNLVHTRGQSGQRLLEGCLTELEGMTSQRTCAVEHEDLDVGATGTDDLEINRCGDHSIAGLNVHDSLPIKGARAYACVRPVRIHPFVD